MSITRTAALRGRTEESLVSSDAHQVIPAADAAQRGGREEGGCFPGGGGHAVARVDEVAALVGGVCAEDAVEGGGRDVARGRRRDHPLH